MVLNPMVVSKRHIGAALAIEEVLERLGDSERLERMRRLGGRHLPPGGPSLNYQNEALVYAYEGLAGALEVIERLEGRVAELEKDRATSSSAPKKAKK